MNEGHEVTHIVLLEEIRELRVDMKSALLRIGRLEGRMTLGATVVGALAGFVSALVLHLLGS